MTKFIELDIPIKIVESYWIEKYSSGIVKILFNVVDRGTTAWAMNDTTYGFQDGDGNEQRISTPEISEHIEPHTMYLRTDCVEKDQLAFVYIPYNLLGRGKDCETCAGYGYYATGDTYSPEQVQCEDCFGSGKR